MAAATHSAYRGKLLSASMISGRRSLFHQLSLPLGRQRGTLQRSQPVPDASSHLSTAAGLHEHRKDGGVQILRQHGLVSVQDKLVGCGGPKPTQPGAPSTASTAADQGYSVAKSNSKLSLAVRYANASQPACIGFDVLACCARRGGVRFKHLY